MRRPWRWYVALVLGLIGILLWAVLEILRRGLESAANWLNPDTGKLHDLKEWGRKQ